MLDAVIRHADLLARIDLLTPRRRLVGPVARRLPHCRPPVRWFYEEVHSASELDLTFPYCEQSPKAWLLPPRETLFVYEKGENGARGRFALRPAAAPEPLALIGVHPCDLHGILLLDRVFEQGYRDEQYLARREQALIVGLDCPRPCASGVFCHDMHCNEAEHGFDAMLYPLFGARHGLAINDPAYAEETAPAGPYRQRARPAAIDASALFGVRFGTPAGRKWLLGDPGGAVCRRPTAEDQKALTAYRVAKHAAMRSILSSSFEELPALLGRSYDSLLWEATARRCYSCGSCNLVCPTCYCFDIRDESRIEGGGARERTWDGCMLRGFAEVAGGHNFRAQPAQRLRHRLFRKGKWLFEQTGLAGCVGCARCDRACTARISSVDVYNQLAEEAQP